MGGGRNTASIDNGAEQRKLRDRIHASSPPPTPIRARWHIRHQPFMGSNAVKITHRRPAIKALVFRLLQRPLADGKRFSDSRIGYPRMPVMSANEDWFSEEWFPCQRLSAQFARLHSPGRQNAKSRMRTMHDQTMTDYLSHFGRGQHTGCRQRI
jgi:hypothetical protein